MHLPLIPNYPSITVCLDSYFICVKHVLDIKMLYIAVMSAKLHMVALSVLRPVKSSYTDNEVVLRKHTPQGGRPTSMAVPLPSWSSSAGIESALDASSRSIAVSSMC